MQAVPVRPHPSETWRWVAHLLIISALGMATWAALPPARPRSEPPTPDMPVLVGPPASSDPTWRTVRAPLRTTVVRDPDPLSLSASVGGVPGEATPSLNAAPPGSEPVGAVVSLWDTPVWVERKSKAEVIDRVPRLAILETLGPARDGRIPVRLGGLDQLAGIKAWVDTAAVASARSLAAPRPWDRPFAFGDSSLRLRIPYRTQVDGSPAAGANCGPASLGMILDSFGINVATDTLRSRAHRYQGTSGPDTGFLLEVIENVAETYGLEGMNLLQDRRYRRWTLDDVRRHLRAGHPVIPQLRYRLMPGREWAAVNYDHYVVLTGFDGDDFFVNDPIPWRGEGQGRISVAQLLRAWSNSDAPMAALALAGPR